MSTQVRVKHQFVPKSPFYFLVSGGVDSVSAAVWLKLNFKKTFSIVHFVHNVQAGNLNMLVGVQDLCDDFGIPLTICEREYDNKRFSDVSENGLRQWRHFEMEKMGGRFITGHHIGDAVENYLSNTFKGCPEFTPIPWFSQFVGFSIYHPFLLSNKQALIDYANEKHLWKYVTEDKTNKDQQYLRNWIRHSIVPEIESRLGLESVVRKKFYEPN